MHMQTIRSMYQYKMQHLILHHPTPNCWFKPLHIYIPVTAQPNVRNFDVRLKMICFL